MSSERSSSAVRNLRSLFENKHNQDENAKPDIRGRSPIQRLGSKTADGSPISKVRASFVPVGQMPPFNPAEMPSIGSEDAVQARRLSFRESEAGGNGAIADLKRELSNESERRRSNPNIAEAVPENALDSVVGTPAAERSQDEVMGSLTKATSKLSTVEIAGEREENEVPAKPDKPTTSAEEKDSGMKPAEPTSEEAVSGGAALPPVAEDLRKKTAKTNGMAAKTTASSKAASKPLTNGTSTATKAAPSSTKPASISTKAASKAAPSSAKSPSNPSKSPLPAKSLLSPKAAPTKDLNRKSSRSSLAAPTAASVARSASATEKHDPMPSKAFSPPSKPRPRDATKPAEVSSRLLAPTAATRARQGEADKTETASLRASTSTKSKVPTTSSARPTPRSSLAARPESRSSQSAGRRVPPPPPDGSFLDRMTRPTAASNMRVHEKVEVKSPPRRKSVGHAKKPAVAKTNGVPKSALKSAKIDKEEANGDTTENGSADHEAETAGQVANDGDGVETPVAQSGTAGEGAMESTPAFAEDGIR